MMYADEKRFPLWLIAAIVMVALSGGMLAIPWERIGDSGCFGLSGAVSGGDCSATILWKKRTVGVELLHVIFIPRGNSRSISGGGAYGGRPRSHGIDSMPEGLFIDGKRIDTRADLRVFVLRKDATVEGIPLTPEEMDLFDPDDFHRLTTSDVWKEKIGPIVQRETSAK